MRCEIGMTLGEVTATKSPPVPSPAPAKERQWLRYNLRVGFSALIFPLEKWNTTSLVGFPNLCGMVEALGHLRVEREKGGKRGEKRRKEKIRGERKGKRRRKKKRKN